MPARKRQGNSRKPSLVFESSPIHISNNPPSPVFPVDNPIHADVVALGSQFDVSWVTSHFNSRSERTTRPCHNQSVRRSTRTRLVPLQIMEGRAATSRELSAANSGVFNTRKIQRRRSVRLKRSPNRENRSMNVSTLGEETISECDSDNVNEDNSFVVGEHKRVNRLRLSSNCGRSCRGTAARLADIDVTQHNDTSVDVCRYGLVSTPEMCRGGDIEVRDLSSPVVRLFDEEGDDDEGLTKIRVKLNGKNNGGEAVHEKYTENVGGYGTSGKDRRENDSTSGPGVRTGILDNVTGNNLSDVIKECSLSKYGTDICMQCRMPLVGCHRTSNVEMCQPGADKLSDKALCQKCKVKKTGIFYSNIYLSGECKNDTILAPDTPETEYGQTRRDKWMKMVRFRARNL